MFKTYHAALQLAYECKSIITSFYIMHDRGCVNRSCPCQSPSVSLGPPQRQRHFHQHGQELVVAFGGFQRGCVRESWAATATRRRPHHLCTKSAKTG
jgi:hypothetical protein